MSSIARTPFSSASTIVPALNILGTMNGAFAR